MTFRLASLSFAACAALPLALSAAQLPGPIPREKDPPSQQTRMQEKRLAVTVYGCIRGKRLVLSSMSEREGLISLLNANELQLEGPKELLTQLRREHENHDDELRGIAIVPSEHGVVIGELYFKSPTLRWDDGTYRLVFDNDKGHAELPIRLE